MDQATVLSGCIFGVVVMLTLWLTYLFNRGGQRVRTRLSNSAMTGPSQLDNRNFLAPKDHLKDLFSRMGQAASKPFMPGTREKQSELRRRLAMAGIYTPSALRVVTGFKAILLVVGLIVGYGLGSWMGWTMLGVSFGGLLGYLVPLFWIKTQVKVQQRSLEDGLPDALDLMV